jgi:hypothetical protein
LADVTFRWRAADTTVATVATVDSVTGLVRARAAGHTTIVASLTVNPAVQGAMVLNVVP